MARIWLGLAVDALVCAVFAAQGNIGAAFLLGAVLTVAAFEAFAV